MKKGLFVLLGISSIGYASKPVWTFTPLTATGTTFDQPYAIALN